ncbi:MAG TPA: sodium:proton antiporter NhaD, partial [Alphaproteobacteria bacterium]
MKIYGIAAILAAALFPVAAFAADPGAEAYYQMGLEPLHPAGLVCIAIFIMSYIAVFFEERIHLRKSKPVMLGAAMIWVVIGGIAPSYEIDRPEIHAAVNHGLGEYAALLLFLLSAMTFIAALQERNVFAVLRARLVQAGLNLRQLFWVTGILAFFISPVADNMTTALVMGAVVVALGRGDGKFIALACVNIVNAANAGGAFSPFGDITTLMVWQAGHVGFLEFFALFLPSVVCFLVPAFFMSRAVPHDYPEALREDVQLKYGAKFIILLGFLTIAMAVSFEQFLGLPPFMGMMAGLSLLMVVAWYIRHHARRDRDFDILALVASAEWDTLLFFFGVIFSVGGLAYMGYMELASTALYDGMGADAANILLGVISAAVDNIPIMFAILSMQPDMNHFQWLLVTLTTGVGGSLLSIGSAAGVALMGVARGHYTFASHLRWTPVLMLGYAAAIAAHYLL